MVLTSPPLPLYDNVDETTYLYKETTLGDTVGTVVYDIGGNEPVLVKNYKTHFKMSSQDVITVESHNLITNQKERSKFS